MPPLAVSRRWGKSRPFHGTVVAIQGLCTVESANDKNTYRVEVDLGESGLEYAPGDALGIYPQNAPEVRRWQALEGPAPRVCGAQGTELA